MPSLRFVALLLAAVLFAPPQTLAQSTNVKIDYVILIDVSGSMVGRPAGSGNVNIFPQVKDALSAFLEEVEPGSVVFITPFAASLGEMRRFESEVDGAFGGAVDYVRSLEATGTATHVYGSMRQVFERYNQFRGEHPDRIAVLMVFTDGLDNGPERMTMRDVVERFRLQRQENDFIYYATLGVDLPPNEIAALVGSGFAAHDPSPAGEVHPVRLIQPRYGMLSFGNLQRSPDAERTLRMDIKGQLPAGFTLRTRTSFPELAARGIYVEVRPDRLSAADETSLGLRLVNAQETPTGDYEGTIELESPDPQVIVVPRLIRARFTYAPPRTVSIQRATLSLGTLDPFRAEEGRDVRGDSVRLALDHEAARVGGNLGVLVRQHDNNPSHLPPTAFVVNGEAGDAHSVDAARGVLTFGIEADRTQLRPGRYSGTLVLEDGSVDVAGAREIPWSVEVAKPPLSRGAWTAIIALLLAGLVGAALFARYWFTGGLSDPQLKGRLTVRAPADAYGTELVLSGQKQVSLGSGTAHFQNAAGRVRIVPERTRKVLRIKVVVEDGNVMIRRHGESHDVPVASESLQDGDQIALPPYRIEYNRY